MPEVLAVRFGCESHGRGVHSRRAWGRRIAKSVLRLTLGAMHRQDSKARYGRRSFLLQTTVAVPAVALSFRNNLRAQGSSNFKLSMCNEAFASANERKSFPETCKAIRNAGYTGIEVAPFSLSDDPIAITAARRREYADAIQSEGLTFAGLHWLLLAPKGLNVVTSDRVIREKSWRHMSHLIDLCADLGQNGKMVLGSPDQRKVTGELTRAEAVQYFTDGLAGIAPHAVERGVTVLIETFSERKRILPLCWPTPMRLCARSTAPAFR